MSELVPAADNACAGRVALITGVSGQDGAWLCRLLLEKGYLVTGTTRSLHSTSFWRLDELRIRQHPRLRIIELDVGDLAMCESVLMATRPAEIYNLGGLSFIGQSFAFALETYRTTGLGASNLLEALRKCCPDARFFQASSSELFGEAGVSPQDEATPFRLRSPYAVAKAFAHWSVATYRESHGVFACSGILYNHESQLRGEEFVTRKITMAAARISEGRQDFVELGNLDSVRDWGYAPEYAEGMWRIMQAEKPDSFILATGRLSSVRKFVECAFAGVGIRIQWRNGGIYETGTSSRDGRVVVKTAAEFFRPAEAVALCGNPQKIRDKLGWSAQLQIADICRIMVATDLKRIGSYVPK